MQGKFEDAEQQLQSAMEKNTNDAETLINLSVVSQFTGKAPEVGPPRAGPNRAGLRAVPQPAARGGPGPCLPGGSGCQGGGVQPGRRPVWRPLAAY
jgi:hypothetical protein